MNRDQGRSTLVKKLFGTAVALCFLFIVIRWFEHNQVYHPYRRLEASGSALGRAWEDVFFETADGARLNGWFFPAESNSSRGRFVLLLCHGNAGNISHRGDLCELLLRLGAGVFVFDYRGYGLSSGRPSEAGTYGDVLAAYDWLRARGFAGSDIVAYGESLGGAVAAELALQRPIAGAVLQSTFTSVPALGAELLPWLPVKWISTIKYDTLSKLPGIEVPVLILHSRRDSMIGFHHAEENYRAAREPKLLRELAGDHNDALIESPGVVTKGVGDLLDLIEARQARAGGGSSPQPKSN